MGPSIPPTTAENLLKDPPNHPGAAGFPFQEILRWFYVTPESCFTCTALSGSPGLELKPTDTPDRVSGCLLLSPRAGMLHPPHLMNYPRAVSTEPRELPQQFQQVLPLGMDPRALTFLMGNLGKSGHKIYPILQLPAWFPLEVTAKPTLNHRFHGFFFFPYATGSFLPSKTIFPAGHQLPLRASSSCLCPAAKDNNNNNNRDFPKKFSRFSPRFSIYNRIKPIHLGDQ